MNGYFVGNHKLMDEESAGGMVIPPVSISSWENWSSAELMEADSNQQNQYGRKIFRTAKF
jgi:hypothetical protein